LKQGKKRRRARKTKVLPKKRARRKRKSRQEKHLKTGNLHDEWWILMLR